jgi:hypothetical protein
MSRHTLTIAVWLALAGASALGAQPLTLAEILFRANQYVVRYEKDLSAVVSEERYTQRIVGRHGVKRTRELASDVLMIRTPAGENWMGFRDVFQVDGKTLGDRQDRLQKLFVDGGGIGLDQARKIADESARFNIGDIQRNFNVPTLPLEFLNPLNQHRFYFEKIDEETIEGTLTWAVRYTEHVRPTFVRTQVGDLFARGTLWIEPAEGRVVRTELTVGDFRTNVRSTLTVTYRRDDRLGLWVPAEMAEVYERTRDTGADTIRCEATYSRFRRFTVQVDEKVAPPK